MRVPGFGLLWRVGVLAAAHGPAAPRARAFVYVDPVDYERQLLLAACRERGIECVEVWSKPYVATVYEQADVAAEADAAEAGMSVEELRELVRSAVDEQVAPAAGAEAAWAVERGLVGEGGMQLLGVLCGSDAGLATAERLLDALVPERSNGRNPARRDKFLTHRALDAAGLASARQAAVTSWGEAEAFLATLGEPLRAVVKPRRGQGSLRVGLATSAAQAKHMLGFLFAEPTSLDAEEVPAGDALLQELLDGDEWAVDLVSRDGRHKVVALWRYDKGPANGAPFVYFCDELMPVAGRREHAICAYARSALDALGWRWGPAHLEVRDGARGPVLVEANAGRFNGVDFLPLTRRCTGCSFYGAAIDAFSDAAAWEVLPPTPPARLAAAGRLVKLVSHVEGTLRGLRHQEELRALPSLLRYSPKYTQLGQPVAATVDLGSVAGFVLLSGTTEQVDADYCALLAMQPTMFEVEEEAEAGGGEHQRTQSRGG